MPRLQCLLALAASLVSVQAHAFFVNPYIGMTEYVNEITGHFVVLDAQEGAAVESGSAGPGWTRTGQGFDVPDPAQFTGASLIPVCRFLSPANNAHFFTANPAECASLRNPASGWIFEKIAFSVLHAGPQCPAGEGPVYRLYNNRHAVHDAAHRFTPDAATRDQMIAAGWIDEGVAFCGVNGGVAPIRSFVLRNPRIADAAACEAQVGACMRVAHLPALSNLVRASFPPSFPTLNPLFTAADVWTAQSSQLAATAHSFVQIDESGDGVFGVRVKGGDRVAGNYASIGPMYQLAGTAPPPGGTDERLFAFRGFHHHTLVASFDVWVGTIGRSDASSHGYGALVLRFVDAKSGRSLYAMVQVYGTVPPVDFVAPDATSGIPIVSTSFRADPAFGTRLAGDFAPCDAQSPCIPQDRFFQFRMTDADFAKALQGARSVDPALSADPADYFLAQFRLHNETFGDADLGAGMVMRSFDVYY